MRLTNDKYRLLDQTALQLRQDYDFLDDDLDVFQLANMMNVTLVPYSEVGLKAKKFILDREDKINDGFFTTENGRHAPKIFYNDEIADKRIKFTICHELEHYVFDDKEDGEYEEAKANHFARQLLIPNCLVIMYMLKGVDKYDLASKFNVSYEVAYIAYTHAEHRINYRGYKLEDYEKDFMNAYYKKHFDIEFDNYQILLNNINKK